MSLLTLKNYPNGLKTLLAHKNGKISGNLTNRGSLTNEQTLVLQFYNW